MEDLTNKFLPQWDSNDHEHDADRYDPYFLGAVITYQENGQWFLADGQQRVITLLLLLMYLYRLTDQREDTQDLNALLRTLIRGDSGIDRSFAVRVRDYRRCFDKLLTDLPFSPDGETADVRRVWMASQHIDACCRSELKEEALPHFTRWLLHRVSLIEIDAGDPIRGKELFVLMNDRGVRLAPLDHLKDYLLTDVPDDLGTLDTQWKSMINSLQAIDPNAPLEHVRTILHGQYFDIDPTDESERVRDDMPHEWLLSHQEQIWRPWKKGLQARLFTEWLEPTSKPYADLLRATIDFTEGLEPLWFNAYNGLPRQFDLTFAAVRPGDGEGTVRRKAKAVANFIDLFVVSRGLDDLPYSPAHLNDVIATLLPAVRESRTVESLSQVLGEAAAPWYSKFSKVAEMRYREGVNRPFVVYFLARLTAWVEKNTGRGEQAHRLLARPEKQRPYEVEHLFTKRKNGYTYSEDFKRERGRLGGLLLLDGVENASLGDLLLPDKVEIYPRYNWLAASLHPDSYRGRGVRRFQTFLVDHDLRNKFRAYRVNEPLKGFIDHRSVLYEELARRIWSPEALGLAPPPTSAGAITDVDVRPPSKQRRVTLVDLLGAHLVRSSESLIGTRRGQEHRATLLDDGRIRIASGACFTTPNRAAIEARNVRSEDGWKFWTVERTGESLYAIRARYVGRAGEVLDVETGRQPGR